MGGDKKSNFETIYEEDGFCGGLTWLGCRWRWWWSGWNGLSLGLERESDKK